jgi:hypothetical protein
MDPFVLKPMRFIHRVSIVIRCYCIACLFFDAKSREEIESGEKEAEHEA